jgi:hypothetical protein
MLEFLRHRISIRKGIYFQIALCRRVSYLLADEETRRALEWMEDSADRQFTQLDTPYRPVIDTNAIQPTDLPAETYCLPRRRDPLIGALQFVSSTAEIQSEHLPQMGFASPSNLAMTAFQAVALEFDREENMARAALLRDIVHNPFRPLPGNPAWNTRSVMALAQAIYTDRAFDRLPILADALEDAGCSDADILARCRGGGEHVRGCWVVDLLTGRE